MAGSFVGWSRSRGAAHDILRLPSAAGDEVAVHPIALRSPFTHMAEVRQYRLVHDLDGLHVLVVLHQGVDREATVRQVRAALVATLARAGAAPPPLDVEVVETLAPEQGHGAKYKLVDSRVRSGSVS